MARRKIKSKQLLFEAFLATIVTFSLLLIFSFLIRISIKPFNFIQDAFYDVQVTDLYFSHLKVNTVVQEIVLINIEDADRAEISVILQLINSLQPKVVGLDVFISHAKDEIGDSLLLKAIEAMGSKLVMAAYFDEDRNRFSEKYQYFEGVQYGHANILTSSDRTKVVREYFPFFNDANDTLWAFPVLLATYYSSQHTPTIKKRNNQIERINYVGGMQSFVSINKSDLYSLSDDELRFLISDKMVLVGFLGEKSLHSSDFDDVFFTPLNEKFAGRSFPDMYGLVIHANIATMILNNDYINTLPEWVALILAFFATFVVKIALLYFFITNQLWYDIMAKLIQFIFSIFIVFLAFSILRYTHFMINVTYLMFGIVFAVDFIYVYESFAIIAFKKFRYKSLFVKGLGEA